MRGLEPEITLGRNRLADYTVNEPFHIFIKYVTRHATTPFIIHNVYYFRPQFGPSSDHALFKTNEKNTVMLM